MQQQPTLPSITAARLRHLVCAHAHWRCEVCQSAEGAWRAGGRGNWYQVKLAVVGTRRKRALCQRCRLYATQEVATVPVTPRQAPLSRSPLERLHIELVPLAETHPTLKLVHQRPVLSLEVAEWMR